MIPLFSNHQVRSADQFAIKKLGIPSIALMENASRSILEAIESNFENLNEFTRFGIVCGKGNNGGDGFALARLLVIRGYDVQVLSIGKPNEIKGDAKINLNVLQKLIIHYPNSSMKFYSSGHELAIIQTCDIVIDCILGTGTEGELKEPYSKIIKKLNNIDAFKISVDIPSGLIEESATGSTIFHSDLTVTLAELKNGLFYNEGYFNSGKIVKGSIGIGSEYFDELKVENYLVEPEDALVGLPVRSKNAHKYSAGKILVIAGSNDLPGAAILSANSALRSGAGAVILAFPKSIVSIAQNKLQEVVVHSYNDEGKGFLISASLLDLRNRIEWADCIVLGPGLGRDPETIIAINSIVKQYSTKKFVLDADALFAIGNEKLGKLDLRNCVLTPHYGEFANLLGIEVNELKRNILGIAKQFVKKHNCFLLLKGAPTILFTPNNEAIFNTSGNASLAKFGSGDVLTGIMGAFIGCNKEIEKSTISATYIHGLCADILVKNLSELSVNATDLIDTISDAINFIRKSFI